MSLFSSFAVSAGGMDVERTRVEIIANNLANAQTTRTERGGPFRRQLLRTMARPAGYADGAFLGGGVEIKGIDEDPSPPRLIYDPSHPEANARGYVSLPNVNLVNEMVNLLVAGRVYEANITAFQEAKGMALKALEMGR